MEQKRHIVKRKELFNPNEIASVIKIWRAGKIYLMSDMQKVTALETVRIEMHRQDITPAQRTTLEILENVLLG